MGNDLNEQEVDEESVIEEPVSEESIGLRLRRPSIGVARLSIDTVKYKI